MCFQSFYLLLFPGVELWGLVFWFRFFHFSNFSVCLFCIITTLIFFIVSLCPCLYHLTQLVPNVTYIDSFVCRDGLIGKTHTHTQKNCSGTVSKKRSSSCQILHRDQSGSDSVKNSWWTQSHKQYDKRVIILFSSFFHMDPCWTIKHR